MIKANRTIYPSKPKSITRLNNGSYIYNYDIREDVIEVPTFEGDITEERTVYSAINVTLNGYPSYKDCVKAIIRKFVTVDEEFDLINSGNKAAMGISNSESDTEKYQDYLNLLSTIKAKVKEDLKDYE